MSHCSPTLGADVAGLGKVAFGFQPRFFLEAVPDTSTAPIEVRIDGVLLPPVSPTNFRSWTYDPVTNAVTVSESFLPTAGQTLELSYQTTCYP